MRDVDGLNAGYAGLLLEEYLDNPEAVPPEWRELFERGSDEVFASLPGLRRLIDGAAATTNGHAETVGTEQPAASADPQPSPAATSQAKPERLGAPDDTLFGAVAAAMALVKAHRMHGHLAARLHRAEHLGWLRSGTPKAQMGIRSLSVLVHLSPTTSCSPLLTAPSILVFIGSVLGRILWNRMNR